jgi:predicted phosphoribosyltransferase
LFNYDEEVQPILNVLLSKSVDQATLEVEEEQELEEIRKYKYEYHKRRQLEDGDWQQEVKREI